MARKNRANNNKEGNNVLTILIALMIAIIWLAIFGILIKFDVGGFGSGVLRPILKDVPIINRILPDVSDTQLALENDYAYTSLAEAVAKIKELEVTIEEIEQKEEAENTQIDELLAELERLKIFEENQEDFETRQQDFDKNVVFAAGAPGLEEYKKFYEDINPANAELIYRQVVEQLQYSDAIQEKAEIYRKMDPENAAKVLETMTADVESVAKILLAMKPKESAAILAEMDHVMAAKITKKMLDMDEERLAS